MRAFALAFLLTAAAGAALASGSPATAPATAATLPAAASASDGTRAATPSSAAPTATASAVRPVTAEQLLARRSKQDPSLVVLDVRTPQEYAEGHVPGAINVPHDQVEQRLGELQAYRDKDVVVYCRSGRRAGLALGVLEKAGFRKLEHLEGDMQAWSAAGRPVAKP